MKMPIVRKLLRVGDSKGITLPKSWIEFFEKETGQRITEVAIEVDRSLTVTPILSKKESIASSAG
jgi:antitoxin component of MazEF toxin-antitoxin module